MKKPVTIVLAVAAVAALIVSCVFGAQKINLEKTTEDLKQQLADVTEAAENTRTELEQQLADAVANGETLENLRTELEGRVTELEQQLADNAASAEKELAGVRAELAATTVRLQKTERALTAARSNACLIYASSDWTVQNWNTADSENGLVKVTPATVNGEGEYTVGLEFAEPAAGLAFGAVSIADGETAWPGCFIRLNAVRVNGQSIPFGNGYTVSDDGKTTRMYLYREWSSDFDETARCWDGNTAEASAVIVDREAFASVSSIEVDFSVLTAPADCAYILFSNSDGSMQNWSPEGSTDGRVQAEPAEIRGEGNGYRTSLTFAEPVKDMSMLALAVRRGEITFPGYALTVTRIWVNGEKIQPLEGLRGYTASDDQTETRMYICNEGVDEVPEDARTMKGDLTDAAAVWVNRADFRDIQSIEIEFGYRPAPVTEKPAETAPEKEASEAETEAAEEATEEPAAEAEAPEAEGTETEETETAPETEETQEPVAENGEQAEEKAAEADAPAEETPPAETGEGESA